MELHALVLQSDGSGLRELPKLSQSLGREGVGTRKASDLATRTGYGAVFHAASEEQFLGSARSEGQSGSICGGGFQKRRSWTSWPE